MQPSTPQAGSWSNRGEWRLSLLALLALFALVACSRSSDRGSGRKELVGSTSSALSAIVQTNYYSPSAATVAYTSAQTAGDVNVVVVGWSDTTAKVQSVTDSAGNSYTLAVGPLGVSNKQSQVIYYAKNIVASAANANVVTVLWTSIASAPDVRIAEYKGLDPSSALDVVAQQTGNSATANSGSVTTTNAKDLLVGAGTVAQVLTGAGTGYTSRIITSDGDDLEDRTVTQTGSYSATAPQSPADVWVMQMVAFKVASGATASFVQVNSATPVTSADPTPQASLSIPFASSQSAGDLNVVVVDWGATTSSVSSVTDSAGNAYALAVGPTDYNGQFTQLIYYAKNIVASSSNVVTVTFSTAPISPDLRIVEYSGLDPTTPLDVKVSHTGSSATPTTGAVTTTNPNDLLVAAATTQQPTTGPGTGFTQELMDDGEIVEDKVVTSTGSYTATVQQSPSAPYVMQMVAFKVASNLCARVTCTASDQCHVAGTCNPSTGVCSNPTAANGTACNDGNVCTQSDTCQSGTCTGSNPVTCAASDQCHVAGTCDPTAGCSNPVAANGTACNDGNACTQTDTCQSGTCTGSNSVTCTASDQCHVAGTCDPSSGACSNPTAANGTSCNDGNACTQTDTCQSGTCTGSNPVTCTASDQCHLAGTCDPSSGTCSNPVAVNGTSCNDGNACTQTDTCQSGTCTGTNPVTCTASDQCHVAGTCDPTSGACSNPAVANGTACNDGNACTQTDTCQSGTCTGSNPVTCTASDQCHVAGACDPSSGTCSNPTAANGTACSDGNACTQTDTCQSGTCTGGNPVTCTASDQCHAVGTCNPTSGTCSNPAVADGTACKAGDVCTTGDTCRSGSCQPGSPVSIDDGNPCTLDTCDPTNGVVHHACAAVDRSVSTALFNADSFLFSGTNPVQTGVAAGTIVPSTMAVVRGNVLSKSGSPMPGVTVTVAGHPEFGSTVTQGDGTFDMAVTGGQTIRLHYALANYLSAERVVQAPWQDYVTAGDVVLLQADSQVTSVDLSSSNAVQVARGTPSTDSDGTRQATVLVPSDTTATMTMPDGSTSPLPAMHVRATEFTVGSNGPSAMPADLPPTSAYTYAVGLTADEALSQGATQVTFSQPLPFYVENFVGFPVGTNVPVGFYDPQRGAWVASSNGVVVQILSVTAGEADLDISGSGSAASSTALAAIGVTDPERQTLANLYSVGQTLWRAPIAHFSNWDLNWPAAPPPGASPPQGPGPIPGGGDGPGPCKDPNASTIACQRQSLGEDLPVTGTPYALHYESDRQIGRAAQLNIPLSGATLPGAPVSINMNVRVGGRSFPQTFPAQPNLVANFEWDGRDAYGRLLQGGQPITITIGNEYRAIYKNVDLWADQGNGTWLSLANSRKDIVVSRVWNGAITLWDARAQGLGGWDLDIHHSLDVQGRMLHMGGGSNLTPSDIPDVIRTVAGNGSTSIGRPSDEGDGVLAATTVVFEPQAVAVGPDGSLYIVDGEHCIRRVTPDGVIHTFAGTCSTAGFSGDGGPAISALLYSPEDIAVGPDGSLYIADKYNQRIRRVFPNGIIQTVAGSGPVAPVGTTGGGSFTGTFSGDGGPAINARFNQPWGVDVATDGTIYIADYLNYRIRTVTPDGIVRTVAGNGLAANQAGNGGPATAASLHSPFKVRVAHDGSFYIVETNGNAVRQVGADGVIRPFAGQIDNFPGYSGDGGPANAATMSGPTDAAVGPDGSVYIADQGDVVRRVDPNGIITTVAGVAGKHDFSGDNGPAAQATLDGVQGIRVGPDGSFYTCSQGRVRRVGAILTQFSQGTGTIDLPSQDGRQVYVFDSNGRHQQTLDAFTGATLFQFAYDGSGRLGSVTDVDKNVTQIQRDGSGNLVKIIGPFGAQTVFTPDANGYLASATDPAGQQTQFTYDANGLLLSKTNPRRGLSQYSYDSLGRLTEDQDPAGGSKTLSRSDSTTGFTVTSTTGLGRATSYQTTISQTGTFSRQNTLPNGLQSSLQFTPAGMTSTTVPDGTTTTTTELPDPRAGFGMLSPVPTVTTKTPSGITSTQTTSRSVTLSGSSLATFTEQTNLNGNAWTRVFNASNSTWTTTSPVGRTTTVTVDSADRPIQVAVPGSAPIALVYDSNGRLHTTTQGSSTWTNAYDAQGYVASITDPLSHAISYTNDPVGRPTQTTLADNRLLGTAYDGDSNTTQITLPSGVQHGFTFTPVDQLASYTPPSVSSASPATQYVYDLDRHLKTVTRPDGATLTYAYDSAGRLQTRTIPQGTVTLAYNASTGQLQSSTAPSGEAIAYAFDGFLKTGETWSGPVPGSLSLGFDSNFRMTSQTVNGTALGFGYDADGLLTGAGALTLTRDAQNGRLTGTTLGSVTDSYGYDGNGLFASYTAAYSGNTLYSESVVRDAAGRITQKTETVQGTTHLWGYTFDVTGRLTDVTKDGSFFSHYGYDADDNRTTYTNTSGTVNPTYDAQDRLTAYGSATYGYTLNGELSTKTVNGQTTNYTYDPLGNLLHVGPASGSAIDYVVDGENRRVGKEVGGTLIAGFLYKDGLNVVAQLDGSGNAVARYVFGSKPNVPDYYTTSAGTFRILTDHLGTPRLVVNTSSGAVVEEIDYDEFGNVTNDTAPGTMVFGFAGGLYDKDTGLVRFGARDYDASVGRWTSKDPTRFAGGVSNLYGYALNDPVDAIDSTGQISKEQVCTLVYGFIYSACLGFVGPVNREEHNKCADIAEHAYDTCMRRKTREDCHDDCDKTWLNQCPPRLTEWLGCYDYCDKNFY
jgi:RHS repeat-associated protein